MDEKVADILERQRERPISLQMTMPMTSQYPYSLDYDDPLIAELYDQSETDTADVELIRRLLGDSGPLRILECFSGTGRILVPLAKDGHTIVGIELAHAMNARAAAKIRELGPEVERRVTLMVRDALEGSWGKGYDVIIMGCNAFYELPSGAAQERCIKFASAALAPGGRVFIDNEDRKQPLTEDSIGDSWTVLKGTGADGTYGELSCRVTGVDVECQILKIERSWYSRAPDGKETRRVYLSSKHPVSALEVEDWLRKHGFKVLEKFGDTLGNPYTHDSDEALFWAKRL